MLKVRLDQLLCDSNLAPSLETARALIGAGQVYIDDRIADKPGFLYPDNASIRLKERCPYVSRGGLKLEKGLAHFHINPTNWTCIDVGASTGGFTDCLLQYNARRVYAIDVAYGQLSWKIRQDPNVIVLERFNARNISVQDIHHEEVNLVVMDVSFISIATLLPPLVRLFQKEVTILALIKPQFELPRDEVGNGGVIVDPFLHEKAIKKIMRCVDELGLVSKGVIPSPILGPKGNKEFLVLITSRPTS
ncbi:MAG: TlyA family RNA methyltransferase [Proteobacteria bacterium]|nr:TlyA family RNA methyltransferase [Pseudomonadota bacterium]